MCHLRLTTCSISNKLNNKIYIFLQVPRYVLRGVFKKGWTWCLGMTSHSTIALFRGYWEEMFVGCEIYSVTEMWQDTVYCNRRDNMREIIDGIWLLDSVSSALAKNVNFHRLCTAQLTTVPLSLSVWENHSGTVWWKPCISEM